jgi:PST family polysaccharide transporter
VIAVGRALGAAALGQLTFAIKVGTQPSAAIVDVGAYSLLPALARISHDPGRFREAVLRTLRWGCALAFPITLVLIPLGTPAIVLVFGAKWLQAGHAVMALGVYCAALFFYSVASETWKAAGRPGMLPRMHGLSFILTALCVGASAPFGVAPATVGMAVSAILVATYAVRGMGRIVDLAPRRMLAEVWPPTLSAAAMAGTLYLTEHLLIHSDSHSHPVGLALLAAQAVFGLLLYVGCLAALSTRWRRELAAAFRRGRPRWITQPA